VAIAKKGLSGKLSSFLADQAWRNDSQWNGTAQIVCLRGCKINADGSLSDNGNAVKYTDHYDDVMVVFGRKPGGEQYLETFAASAKPGLAWVRHRSYAGSGRGCPTVQPGQYKYARGKHKGRSAMRQASGYPVCVIRDLDQDARLEESDLVDYPLYTGINIHAGGIGSHIGYNSSGCQIIRGGWYGRAWRTFHDLIYRVAGKQKLFHYTVADFLAFGEWHDHPEKRRGPCSVLRFGSYGGRVEQLQERLSAAGYYGHAIVDEEFGRMTDEAVRVYQRKHGLPCDGAVTQAMTERLGE